MQIERTLALHIFILGMACALPLAAQSPSGTLRVQVLDPSGAAVVDAVVLVKSTTGGITAVETNLNGLYEIKGLVAGTYSVQVTATGFAPYEKQNVEVGSGKPNQLDVSLELEVQQEEVNVEGETPQASVDSSNNLSALVIKGDQLEALSDDPEELAADLQALAGPAAGPNGGQIYVDGFSDGRLPPKSAIREIRVNQNPFSAQYNELGYGRTEIFTKPGADKYHGSVGINFNNSELNSRNPFVTSQPGYHSERLNADFGGPLSKKASFFFTLEHRNITDTSVISAFILDSNLNPVPFNDAVPNPRKRTAVSPRFDFQLTPNNTLTLRYEGELENEENSGIGLFSLPTQALDQTQKDNEFHIGDTQIFGANVVNETRYRYQRRRTDEQSLNFDPTIRVLSAFTGGGNNDGTSALIHSHHELQNYTSITKGKHLVKLGGRLRVIDDSSDTNSGFNGTFTFGSLDAYRITELGLAQGMTPAQIRAAGGGADQFSIVSGIPLTKTNFTDVGLYAEDDWRLRNNLSLSMGLRYESQNAIHDHMDFAPRVSLAWGIGGKGGPPKTVLRTGFGLFYERFTGALLQRARRLNGTNQLQFVVPFPDCYPSVSNCTMLAGNATQPTVYQIDPVMSSPYLSQAAISIERQISKTATASVTYVNTRGVHQFMTRNINAPLPGTYDASDPDSAVRPLGNIGNLYQYESSGVLRQNQVIANFNIRGGRRLTLFTTYTLNYANGNTAGAGTFPLNQYDLSTSYGRTAYDVRHRAFLGGTLNMPRAVRLNSFIVTSSGSPFDFSVGQDLNGDSIFNDRPGIATNLSSPTVVGTPWGAFDTAPVLGQSVVAPNYGTGPRQFMLNLRLSKVFGFGKATESAAGGASSGSGGGPRRGPRGGGLGGRGLSGGGGPGPGMWGDAASGRRYTLTLSVFARNLFNIVNLAPPVGNLSSPFFGQSNSIAGGPFFSNSANRRLVFQATFGF